MLKMGFNEGCTWDGNRGCADQSLMADLKACAKYGIKGIDIRFDCLAKYLEEGGTLEAEQEVSAATLQECRIEAQKQQAALRREFALSVEERGMCPFRDVQITCVRKQGGK